MSAPERIWADRRLIYPCSQGKPGATEFVRADIHEAEVLRLRADARAKDAEIARLREALRFYADERFDGYDVAVTDYGMSTEEGHIIKDAGDIARAALGETP